MIDDKIKQPLARIVQLEQALDDALELARHPSAYEATRGQRIEKLKEIRNNTVSALVPQIVEVWQVIDHGVEGESKPTMQFFFDKETAKRRSVGYYPVEPRKRLAVDQGTRTMFIIDDCGPQTIYTSIEDQERGAALAKLTQREKDLLNIK